MDAPTAVLDVQAGLGEGPVWDAGRGRLVFVDILAPAIYEFDPKTGDHRVLRMDVPVSAVACTRRGDWVVAGGRGFYRVDPDTGSTTALALVEPDNETTRMNDGAVDAAGRFWAGSMSTRGEPGRGTLWRLDADGSAAPMLRGVTTSNGPDWSPDHSLMYYVDTRTRRIDVFDFDVVRGTVANRRTFVDLADAGGRPDGVVVDADGGVWVALWAGGAVQRYDPAGRLERSIAFPATLTTKPAFGGADLADLFVTTARARLTADERRSQPLAGALFHLRPGVRGKPANLFGD